jgi:hypothetical protein
MAMLPNGQLRFAHGLLWTALLALGMQSDPLFAQTSEESKSDTKDGLVVLVAVDQLRRDRLAEVAGGALSQLLAEGESIRSGGARSWSVHNLSWTRRDVDGSAPQSTWASKQYVF